MTYTIEMEAESLAKAAQVIGIGGQIGWALNHARPAAGAHWARSSRRLGIAVQIGSQRGADDLALAGCAGFRALRQVVKQRVGQFDRDGFYKTI